MSGIVDRGFWVLLRMLYELSCYMAHTDDERWILRADRLAGWIDGVAAKRGFTAEEVAGTCPYLPLAQRA